MCKSSVEYCCCGNCWNTDSVVVAVDESSCYVVLITDVDDLLSVGVCSVDVLWTTLILAQRHDEVVSHLKSRTLPV